MNERDVVDTNVMMSALLSPVGANRAVLRACLSGKARPLMEMALYLEYENVLAREDLMQSSPLPPKQRQELLAAFLSTCEWVRVYTMVCTAATTRETTCKFLFQSDRIGQVDNLIE